MDTLQEVIEYAKTKDSEHDFDCLLEMYEGVNVVIRRMRGPAGAATFDTIYIDPRAVDVYGPMMFYFILLHELCHFKRMQKLGVEYHMEKLSLDDFDAFFEHVLQEEQIADRYAAFCYNQLNKMEYIGMTQELHLEDKQEEYKPIAGLIFGKIQNNFDNYNKLVESMMI